MLPWEELITSATALGIELVLRETLLTVTLLTCVDYIMLCTYCYADVRNHSLQISSPLIG